MQTITKTETYYKCKDCLATYTTEKECLKHEASHLEPNTFVQLLGCNFVYLKDLNALKRFAAVESARFSYGPTNTVSAFPRWYYIKITTDSRDSEEIELTLALDKIDQLIKKNKLEIQALTDLLKRMTKDENEN